MPVSLYQNIHKSFSTFYLLLFKIHVLFSSEATLQLLMSVSQLRLEENKICSVANEDRRLIFCFDLLSYPCFYIII